MLSVCSFDRPFEGAARTREERKSPGDAGTVISLPRDVESLGLATEGMTICVLVHTHPHHMARLLCLTTLQIGQMKQKFQLA